MGQSTVLGRLFTKDRHLNRFEPLAFLKQGACLMERTIACARSRVERSNDQGFLLITDTHQKNKSK
jgi:hypothetical protein